MTFPWDNQPIGAAGKARHSINSALVQAAESPFGLPSPLPLQKGQMKKRSSRVLRQEQLSKEEIASAQAAADKEEDARMDAEIEKQRKEDAESAEREKAAAQAKAEENKAKGVLSLMQQVELDEARKMFRGELTENDYKILAEAKKEFGEDFMNWGLEETKVTLNQIIMGS